MTDDEQDLVLLMLADPRIKRCASYGCKHVARMPSPLYIIFCMCCIGPCATGKINCDGTAHV